MADVTSQDKHGERQAAAARWLDALRAREGRRLALWTPVAFGLGVQAYFLWPYEPDVAASATALLGAALLCAAAWRRAIVGAAGLAILLAALGFGAAMLRAHAVAAPVLGGAVEALVEGRVRTVSQSAAGRPRLLLEQPRIWGLTIDQTPARVRVTLMAERHGQGLAPGDWVSVVARLGPPGGPAEPGAFDFARAAWFERLGGVGVARSRVARIDGPPATGLAPVRLAVDRLRGALSEGLRARIDGEAGAFAAAIVTGDRAALPVEALQALRDSNLAHLLAISGLHMAIVCGLVFGAVRLGLALTPGVGVRAPVKALAAAAALGAGLGYLAVSGGAVATQRAFVMAAVVFVAMMVARPAVTLRALALAAMVILAFAPESLLQVGFQMSFAATIALVAAYEAARDAGWLGRRTSVAGKIARYALGLLLTSAIAGLATAPFAAFHFNRVTSFGLAANLAAVPVMGAVVAPALCLAAVLSPIGLEGPALRLAGVGVDWILTVARTVAGWEGAARTVAEPAALALWCVVAGGLWLCLWRGPIRLAGAPVLALAGALWLWPTVRPDLLIAPQAATIGVLTPAGRALDPARPDRFAAETWLRRDGDAADASTAAARLGFGTEGPWRVATLGAGWEVAVFRGARLSQTALSRRCAPRRIVIAPNVALNTAQPDATRVAISEGRAPLDNAQRRSAASDAAVSITAVSAAGRESTASPDACIMLDRIALGPRGALAGWIVNGVLTLRDARPRGGRLWAPDFPAP